MEKGGRRTRGGTAAGGERRGAGCWRWRLKQNWFPPSDPRHLQPGRGKPACPVAPGSRPRSAQGTGSPASPPPPHRAPTGSRHRLQAGPSPAPESCPPSRTEGAGAYGGNSGYVPGSRPGRAESGGNRPAGGKGAAGGRGGGGRSRREGEEEPGRFARAGPGPWGDWSLRGSWSSGRIGRTGPSLDPPLLGPDLTHLEPGTQWYV